MVCYHRLRNLFGRKKIRREIEQELSFHIEERVDELKASGLPEEEARRLARRQFGNYTLHQEDTWEADVGGWIESILRDLRHSFRRLARDWRFTLAAILILSLGIGANTAMFSLINSALFRNQHYRQPDRLVNIYQNDEESGAPFGISLPVYEELSGFTDVFSEVSALTFIPLGVNYQEGDTIRPALVEFATSNFLTVVGMEPAVGRWLDPEGDRIDGETLVVVGYATWRGRFNSAPDLVGRRIPINGVPATVVGIGPQGLNSSGNSGIITDFWLSISGLLPLFQENFRETDLRGRKSTFLVGRARLRDGVRLAQAQAAMDNLGMRLAADYPAEDPGKGMTVLSVDSVRIHPRLDFLLLPATAILQGAVALVLLIACSNLSTLLLVRGSSRSKEVGIRLAVGAGRGQIIRHLLAENIILALVGGLGGFFLGGWTLQFLPRLLTSFNLPLTMDFALDYRVFAFAVGLSAATGIAIGLVPALKSSRVNLVSTLRDEGQRVSSGRRWFTARNLLVMTQVAVSFLLLVCAGALFRNLLNATRLDMGFAVNGVAVLETDARYAGYDLERSRSLAEELSQRVAALPGVVATSISRGTPISELNYRTLVIEGHESDTGEPGIQMQWLMVGPGFFETLEIPILYGREFDSSDRAGSRPVALVNEVFARTYFDTPNAVGRSFSLADDERTRISIVGVVSNVRREVEEEPIGPLFYLPAGQVTAPATTIIARSMLAGPELVGAMQRELRAIDGSLPVIRAETMSQHVDGLLTVNRIALGTVGALALFGLLLAALGLYSVVAFAVSSRYREIGVRMALGARGSQVVRLVMQEVSRLVGAGVVVGVALALAVVKGLALMASGASDVGNIVQPSVSATTLVAVALFMLAVGLLAAYVPSRWAARIDPLRALRQG